MAAASVARAPSPARRHHHHNRVGTAALGWPVDSKSRSTFWLHNFQDASPAVRGRVARGHTIRNHPTLPDYRNNRYRQRRSAYFTGSSELVVTSKVTRLLQFAEDAS